MCKRSSFSFSISLEIHPSSDSNDCLVQNRGKRRENFMNGGDSQCFISPLGENIRRKKDIISILSYKHSVATQSPEVKHTCTHSAFLRSISRQLETSLDEAKLIEWDWDTQVSGGKMREEGGTILKCEWRGHDDRKTDYISKQIGCNRRNRD